MAARRSRWRFATGQIQVEGDARAAIELALTAPD
jgi:hypothetical protein